MELTVTILHHQGSLFTRIVPELHKATRRGAEGIVLSFHLMLACNKPFLNIYIQASASLLSFFSCIFLKEIWKSEEEKKQLQK